MHFSQWWISVCHSLQSRVWQGHSHDGHIDDQVHPTGCSIGYRKSDQLYHYICIEITPTDLLLPGQHQHDQTTGLQRHKWTPSSHCSQVKPRKPSYTNCNITTHSGRVSILLGSDNYHGEKGLNSPDLILLLKTQVPKLLVNLHQEELVLALNKSPSWTPVMSPTSMRHQFTLGSRNNLQCLTSTSSPNLRENSPQIYTWVLSTWPALKPPWTIYKVGVTKWSCSGPYENCVRGTTVHAQRIATFKAILYLLLTCNNLFKWNKGTIGKQQNQMVH